MNLDSKSKWERYHSGDCHSDERGAIIVFAAFVIAALLAVGALVVDLGNAWKEQRRIQFATDATALAALDELSASEPGAVTLQDVADVVAAANDIAVINNLSLAEIASYRDGIKFGTWVSGGGFTEVEVEVEDSTDPEQVAAVNAQVAAVNALAVPALRNTPTILAKLFGVQSVRPTSFTIAALPITTATVQQPVCLRPFGIENASMPLAMEDVDWGNTVLTVGNNSPSNWGKMDLGGNMSSGTNFRDAMINGACDLDPVPYVGQGVSPGTGFGGPISSVFEELFNMGAPHTNMLLSLVDEFPNGNSGLVTIEKFLEVELVRYGTGNGMHWDADLRLIAAHDTVEDATPQPESVPTWDDRILVQ